MNEVNRVVVPACLGGKEVYQMMSPVMSQMWDLIGEMHHQINFFVAKEAKSVAGNH